MSNTAQSPSIKLTDTQHQLLSAALQHADLAFALPERLKGKAAERVAQSLPAKALVREIRAKADLPVWRQESDGRRFSFVLTKAGKTLAAGFAQVSDVERPAPSVTPASAAALPASPDSPRSGTKLDSIIVALRRDQGTSVTELMAATGWLPQTTRAALTGLRKRGYAVIRVAGEDGSVYRIADSIAAAA